MGSGWRMEWGPGTAEPSGPRQVLVAEIATSGAIGHAPRVLRLWADDSHFLVRDVDGRLILLETDHLTAVPSGTDGVTVTSGSAKGGLLPEDTAAEAQAMLSLDDLAGWADASLESVRHGADGFQQARLVTGQGSALRAVVDAATRVVLSVDGESLRGPFRVEMTARRYVPWDPDLFEPR